MLMSKKIPIYFISIIFLLIVNINNAHAVIPPDEPGGHSVGMFEDFFDNSEWGRFDVLVFYPSDAQGFASPPYAAVAFSPGYAAWGSFYSWIGRHLASWGYVTILLTPPSPFSLKPQQWADGLKGCLDYLLECNNTSGNLLEGMIDESKLAISGHSMGGMATILATSQDPRIKTGISLAPGYFEDSMAELYLKELAVAARKIEVPMQIQIGELDGYAPPSGAKFFYYNLSADKIYKPPKAYVEIWGSNHVNYLNFAFFNIMDSIPYINEDQHHVISQKYITAWLNYFLYEDNNYRDYIFGDEAKDDVSNFDNPKLSDLKFVEVESHINLLAPQEGATLPQEPLPTFQWESDHYCRFKVMFSRDPDFPDKKTITMFGGNDLLGKARWISSKPLKMNQLFWAPIKRMAEQAGIVYWRVKGRDKYGNIALSHAQSFHVGE